MNEIKTSCAPADSRNLTWDGMNWSKCETYVRKLQARIVKAQKEGRHNKVKSTVQIFGHVIFSSFTPFVPKQDKARNITQNSFVQRIDENNPVER